LKTADNLFIGGQKDIYAAGVAEPFRRRPAEPLYMGSTPIPGFIAKPLYSDVATFLWSLKKEGLKETTIVENYSKVLKNIAKFSHLDNPDLVLEYIASKDVSEGRKELMSDVYARYCLWKGLDFIKPRYKRQDKLPYVPLELDIEALVSALPRKLSIFTRALKETGARPGEMWRVKWIDIDFQGSTLTINNPEKGSRARRLKVSSQLIGLLSSLPRKSDYVYRKNPKARLDTLQTYFMRERKKVAKALNNSKIQSITWKSLRHFKATMEYHRTKDILYVKELLGHVNINNTLVYTHLVNFDSGEYACKVARTVEEAKALIEACFDYVTEMDGVKLFRKRL
jgi:integrase